MYRTLSFEKLGIYLKLKKPIIIDAKKLIPVSFFFHNCKNINGIDRIGDNKNELKVIITDL